MGQAFFLTGRGKLENFPRTVEFFTNLGIPMPELNAAFVSRLEFYGGMLLIVGLATRLVAAGLASTMVVALMTADKQTLLDALRGAAIHRRSGAGRDRAPRGARRLVRP